jgi:hypothetical protein
MEEMRNEYIILVRKHEGMRSLGRPESRWDDNIGLDLRKIQWKCAAWMHVA